MTDDAMYVMTPIEVAWGYLVGHTGTLPPPRDNTLSPRQALEAVLLNAMLRSPCGVAFSGGRDSSMLLAVATHVARREGLPEPIPMTWVFPEAPATEESSWQEMVVRHLRLADWQRIELRDEFDVVGPLARSILEKDGVVWPPTLHGDLPLMEAVRGGTLLDGEGGDEVLGVEFHRVAPLTALLGRQRPPLRWGKVRSALGAAAPETVRRKYARRRYRAKVPVTWLRPAALDALYDAVADNEAAQPLSFAVSVQRVPRRRTQVHLAHNRRILARRYDVDVSSPLLHPEFVHAVARDGGWLGRGDRTAVLRRLIPDLLPDAMLARTTKAGFREAFNARHTREFAESWTGDGLNEELVDTVEIRRIWRSGRGIAPTAALLQTAWLADHQVNKRLTG